MSERVRALEAKLDVAHHEAAKLEAMLTGARREALGHYLGGFNTALVQVWLLCLEVDLIVCDISKEIVDGRLVDLGLEDPIIEGEALEGAQEVGDQPDKQSNNLVRARLSPYRISLLSIPRVFFRLFVLIALCK